MQRRGSGEVRLRDRSCESGEQRYESYRIVRLLADAARSFFDHGQQLHAAQLLVVARKRQHHATADLEIAKQRSGYFSRRRRDDDAIDFEIFAEVRGAVTVLYPDVVDLQREKYPLRCFAIPRSAVAWCYRLR